MFVNNIIGRNLGDINFRQTLSTNTQGVAYGQKKLICPTCGRPFMSNTEWRYKEHDKKFCRWSCLCRYREEKEMMKKQ